MKNLNLPELRLPDGGLPYTETNMEQFIVEPFNAISAVVFVFIALYWWYRIKGNYKRYSFFSVIILLLALGGVGGTLYHGFRSHFLFMLMDWGPILIICILSSAYFLFRLSRNWMLSLSSIVVSVIIQLLAFQFLSEQVAINVSYFLLAILVLAPTFLILKYSNFYAYKNVVFALVFFVIALLSRVVDPHSPFEIGTHFLWHVFGAFSCFFMFRYLFKLYQFRLKPIKIFAD